MMKDCFCRFEGPAHTLCSSRFPGSVYPGQACHKSAALFLLHGSFLFLRKGGNRVQVLPTNSETLFYKADPDRHSGRSDYNLYNLKGMAEILLYYSSRLS